MSASEYLPESRTLAALQTAAQQCKGCDLYKHATQTVFGEGSRKAKVILIGEQPGDREDQEGKPFVGPAGRLLDEAIFEAGLDRKELYVTNAVKHFKWEPRGKRRLHKKPSSRELKACQPWLEAEIEALSPEVVVCLGATAAQAIIGRSFRITQQHGQFVVTDWSPRTLATWHPSAILRAPDEERRRTMRAEMIHDLSLVAGSVHL